MTRHQRRQALRLRSRRLAAIIVVGCLGLTAACSTASSRRRAASSANSSANTCPTTPKAGGTVKIINEGGGLNPITENEVLVWSVFDALLQQDITGALHPGLAEKWDISSDGLTYTFHLRTNAKWTDGKPVDANDVVFTYDKVMDQDVQAVNRHWFSGVLNSWKAVDQFTVQFTLRRPASPILTYLAQQRIAPKSLFGKLTDRQINTMYTQKAPVTSGPFKWTKTVPGQVVTISRNDDYYFPRGSNDYRTVPWVDSLQFYPWGDPQTNVLQMKNKTRDTFALTMTEAEYDQLAGSPGLSIKTFPVGIYTYLMLNNENPLFSDVRVRQAMLSAIDRQSIVKSLLPQIATVANSFVDPTSWAYSTSVPTYSFDTGKAKQMLAAAGWTPGSDGILQKDGKKFSFEVLVIAADYGAKIAEPIQAQLKNVGIQMTIRTVPTFQEMATDQAQSNFVAAITNDGYESYPDRRHRWLSTLTPPAGINIARYKNPALDTVLNDAWSQPLQSPAQKADYQKMQTILAQDLPWLPLYYPKMVQVSSNTLCGTESGSIYYVQTASKWWLNR